MVQSIDHSSKRIGQYFNFFVSDVDTYLGNNWATGTTKKIDQYRNGVRIVEAQGVVLWNTPNGGTVGDGHGRYDTNTLGAAPGQWKNGDYFCLFGDQTLQRSFSRYFEYYKKKLNLLLIWHIVFTEYICIL